MVDEKSNWPSFSISKITPHFKSSHHQNLQKLVFRRKIMDKSTVSEKNLTFDFDIADQESFTTFGKEETSGENLDWFGNETKKLHEKK